MIGVEKDILNALDELDAAVARMRATEPKPDLVPLFTRLNGLASKLPRDSHSQLIHYLTNASYKKARLWLTGRDAENTRGACGRQVQSGSRAVQGHQ